MCKFQSTRPRGARRAGVRRSLFTHFGFNPRARVGRDRHRMGERLRPGRFNPRARVGRDRHISQ